MQLLGLMAVLLVVSALSISDKPKDILRRGEQDSSKERGQTKSTALTSNRFGFCKPSRSQ